MDAAIRRKISDATKLAWTDLDKRARLLAGARSLERRAKLSQAAKGRVLSPNALENVRRAARDPVRRQKISRAMKGRVFSEEQLARMRKPRVKPFPESYRRKHRARMLGSKLPDWWRQAISDGLRGKKHSQERRNALRPVRVAQWQKPEYVKAVFSGWNRRPNRLEKSFQKTLDTYFPGHWKYVGGGEFSIGRRVPDFVNINGHKAVIEVFGRYWHQKTDAATRTRHFKRYGFRTLCVWEDVTEQDFVKKVSHFMGLGTPEQVETFRATLEAGWRP